MKTIFNTFLLLLISFSSFAQDSYHQNLQSQLQSDYDLPVGSWIFSSNEVDIYNESTNYGSSNSITDISGEDFSKVYRFIISQAGANPWDAGFFNSANQSIQTGDKILLVFNIRSVGGPGQVNFFAENSVTFEKEVILTLDVTEDWKLYYVPFSSQNNYSAGSLNVGLHLAALSQTIEFGGFTGLNYDNNVELSDLPEQINNDQYDGSEPDAPWRAAAQDRIEVLRKANLTIEAKDQMGNPVDSGSFFIEMQAHDFAFGTAITAERLAGNNNFNLTYQNKLIDLDGNGHGFNWVVFENDLKWPAWEDEWFVSKPQLVNAVSWLADNDIQIRGHTLVWPGFGNMPSDIENNSGNLNYIRDRVNGHLESILNYPGISEHIAEWDVLNETVTNTSLEETFHAQTNYPTGREILAEIFEKAREEDPNTGLWINDYVTLSIGNSSGNPAYENLKRNVQELLDAGVDIEGIGFQGHIGGFPNGIPAVLETLDDFYNSFGLKAKITEFDMPDIVSEELGAQYLSDILTATFSHPSMNGFLFWSFWDGATYMNPGTNLYRMDWSETPAHEAYTDLLFNKWWTNEGVYSNAEGLAELSVFKGKYKISYECNGELVVEEIDITEDVSLNVVCDNITTSNKEITENLTQIELFPNPTNEILSVKKSGSKNGILRILDMSGKQLFYSDFNQKIINIPVQNLSGIYLLEYLEESNRSYHKFVVN